MLQEQWRSIKGYEGLYEISNFARVKRLARKFIDSSGHCAGVSECMMKISTDESFPVVNLMKDKKYHREDLCMLMKINWMGLEWYQVVDYIDGELCTKLRMVYSCRE